MLLSRVCVYSGVDFSRSHGVKLGMLIDAMGPTPL